MAKKYIAVGTVIAVILFIASLIDVSRTLFPFFVAGGILSLIWLIISMMDSYGDATLPGISLAVFIVLVGATFLIGHTFGDSNLGNAITNTAGAINTVDEIQKNASIAIVDAAQNATSQTYHNLNYTGSERDEANTNLTYEIIKVGIKVSD